MSTDYVEGRDYLIAEDGPYIETDVEPYEGETDDGTLLTGRKTITTRYTDYDPESSWDELPAEEHEWWIDLIVRWHAVEVKIADYPPSRRETVDEAGQDETHLESTLIAMEEALAELPSLDALRAGLLGMISTPATRIAAILQAPGGQLARVFGAFARKDEALAA